jgi:hypothetical protein
MRARFWWGNLKERDQDVGIDVRMIIELFSVKQSGRVWTGFVRLGTGTGGEQFRALQCSVRSVPVFTNCRRCVLHVFTGDLAW